MKKVLIKSLTNENIILEETEVAKHFIARLRGLIGRKNLEPKQGLIIFPCNSIHMFGMKFSIDVIFLDKNKMVCHLIPGMKIKKISPIIKNARYVLEAPIGTILQKKINLGDRFEMIER
jgi:Uncharacterized conserved protein